MQTNLLWTGRAYYSLENCLVDVMDDSSDITSTIIGFYEKKLYKIDYRIKTNQNWETVFFEINSQHSNQIQSIRIEGDGKGNWLSNGRKAAQFDGCIDIDISLTPLTNTLPIKRLNLRPAQSQEIHVIYCDLLEQQLTPVRQRYSCLSATNYHYENIPNDFEAVIQVDEAGFVTDYPQLFSRTTAITSSYNTKSINQ